MSQDIDARRSTAAQFFMEDDSENQKSSYNKVVDWLNHAAVATDKLDNLRRVQEIVINKEENLLDNFLEEVLGFQNDRSQDVRKFIVGFIEEACKKDPDILPRVVTNLAMLLRDQSIQVQKRVVQAACSVYRSALEWLAHARAVSDEMEVTWNVICAIKGQIFGLVDSDNDGLRTQAIKFLECVVLMQTYPEPDSLRRDNDFSLEDVPLTLKIARRRKLEEEAHMVFELMLKFHGSMHISSVNLMTCMGSIALIAKMRPQFMGKVVTALETLNANLPPTLSKSQVSSVRKHLKLQLLNLLRLPSSVPFHNNITTMLTDLGTSNQEMMRCLPRMEELRRQQKRLAAAAKTEGSFVSSMSMSAGGPTQAKRARMDAAATAAATVADDDEYDEDDDDEASNHVVSMSLGSSNGPRNRGSDRSEDPSRTLRPPVEQAVDITEQFIVERLSPEMAAQLVMISMAKLPETMPPHFSSMYTPIAAAGTQNQVRHVARLLATQLTALGLGPGYSQQLVKSAVKNSLRLSEEEDDEGPSSTTKSSISSALTGMLEKDKELMPSGISSKATKQRIRILKLSEITKPLEPEVRNTMLGAAIKRILLAEKPALLGGVASVRNRIITTIASTYDDLVRNEVLQFLLEDIKSHLDLGLAWLYEEYVYLQGFNRMPAFLRPEPESPEKSYNDLLCALVKHLIDKADVRDRDALLSRLYLEAPLITEEATELLRTMCLEESRAAAGLALLQELVTRRPPRQLVFLNALLVHTAHENTEIRSKAISCVVALYDRGDLRCIIEEYAILYLGFLRLPAPPDVLFGPERGRPTREQAFSSAQVNSGQGTIGPDGMPVGSSGWTEEMVRACLYLYLALLPVNEKLIHELARVYVTTVADVKRTILRLLEQPVRGMGMDSPELLRLVEECPKGAETLVTRVIHILTDKTPPSAELVARVRDLYHSRVADVRFLIPVLNGLTKKEVIAALPKLIKLNPVVVKEVFNRLLGTHNEASSHTSPLTPAELLIALHTIDPSKCELKTVIKATSLCFAERQAYTQEVLAVVMQHLMELNPLPTLLMRTVIQALSFYPRLIGFVMNILQRLILKQVWKQRKVWEGFVKCCQRTRPQSFQVLLQLPPAQLCDVFEASPDLRAPLLQHVMSFTENQRAHIPPSIMDVLLGKRRTVSEEYDEQVEPRSPSELTIDIKEEPETEPAPPGLE